MKQMRRLGLVVAAGVAIGSLGLAGCQQDLRVDDVYYECETDDECGPGYTCGTHPQHGSVCLSEELDTTADAGPDAEERDADEDTTSPTSPLRVDVTNESSRTLRRVRVYLVTDDQWSCSQLVARRAQDWPIQVVDVDTAGSIPQVEFVDAPATVSLLATGLTQQGVRAAVGCADDVSVESLDGQPVEITLREQLPVFAPTGYNIEMMWETKEEFDLYGPYIRALARLPFEPGTALLGCTNAESDLCQVEDELGLLHLIAMARIASNTGLSGLAQRRLGYWNDESLRDSLRDVLNNTATSLEIDINSGALLGRAELLLEGVAMRGQAQLEHDSIDEWSAGVPVATDLTGAIDFSHIGMELCEGDLPCAQSLASEPNANAGIEITGGQVRPDRFSQSNPADAVISGFDFGAHFSLAFTKVIYPSTITGTDFSAAAGITNFLKPSRWTCSDVAEEATGSQSSGVYQDIVGACTDFTDASELAHMLRDLRNDMKRRFTLKLNPEGDCMLTQPSYEEGTFWHDSPVAPMPMFAEFGATTKCQWSLEILDVDNGNGAVAGLIGSFEAIARSPQ